MLESLFNNIAGFQACDFIKKETPVQVFSWECWKIFKKTYLEKHLRTAASVIYFSNFVLFIGEIAKLI